MNNNTAILVFIRSADNEVIAKRLLPNDTSKNRSLWQLLNNRAIETAKSTELPVIVIDSKIQRGRTFAERFHNAFQDVFSLGYTHVISIGNDTPNLSCEHIKTLERKLSHTDIVIGKTQRGIYSLGLSKKAFQRLNFDVLDWKERTIYSSIITHSVNKGLSIENLEETLFELNTFHDVCEYRAQAKLNGINCSFISQFLRRKWNFTPPNKLPILHVSQEVYFRGPPVCI